MQYSFTNISKNYKTVYALNSVDFSFKSNEIVGIWGPNGSGKSTILNIISTMLEPDSGKIPKKLDPRKIGYLFQNP